MGYDEPEILRSVVVAAALLSAHAVAWVVQKGVVLRL
jgi:hypothetical protein